ncbi:MAG: polymer-forming cytoskeletal protein [Chloroflexi bacterium]|nr:polymer-forming cytoskeletal protein [Chloroflexota bacterium]
MKIQKLLMAFMMMCLLLVFPQDVNAAGLGRPVLDDRIIMGGTFTLEAGEVQDGSLLVLGGVVQLEAGSRVARDVVVLAGTVSMAGEVEGNVVAIGGVVALAETVFIHGDLIAPASVVSISEAAVVEGQIMTDLPALRVTLPEAPAVPPVPQAEISRPGAMSLVLEALQPFFRGVWLIFVSAVAAALGVLVYVFLPQQTRLASEAAGAQPAVAGGVGLLSIGLLFPLAFFLGITILLIPVSAALLLVAGIAWVFGWIATGQEAGRRVAEAFGQDWSTAAQVGIGTFVLTLVVGSVGLIFWEFLGVIALMIVGGVGMGAVVLTRFGTRSYESPAVQNPPGRPGIDF